MDGIEMTQGYADGQCGVCGKEKLLFCTTVTIGEQDYTGGICMECMKNLLEKKPQPPAPLPNLPIERLEDRMYG